MRHPAPEPGECGDGSVATRRWWRATTNEHTLCPTSNGSDAIDITGTSRNVNLANIGILFEAGTLLEQQRQGAITRQLAAWAAILAVPTAIAGIYGMNFEVMPELKWQYGYYTVVGIIVALCAFLYVRFKRANWL
jgi:Mg2+ and Co2+ transporter CorA